MRARRRRRRFHGGRPRARAREPASSRQHDHRGRACRRGLARARAILPASPAVRAAARVRRRRHLPTDLETVSEARARPRAADGPPRPARDVNIPSLDPTGPSYEPAVLARFALDLLQTFSVVPSDGELLLLLPALICAEAQRLLDGADFVPAELRASGRVASVVGARGAAGRRRTPAAVLIVGLAPSENSDDDSLVRARGWLRLAQTASTAVSHQRAARRVGARRLGGWEAVTRSRRTSSRASTAAPPAPAAGGGARGAVARRARGACGSTAAERPIVREVASLDGEPDEGEILDALRPSIELAAAAADAAAVADAAAAPPRRRRRPRSRRRRRRWRRASRPSSASAAPTPTRAGADADDAATGAAAGRRRRCRRRGGARARGGGRRARTRVG